MLLASPIAWAHDDHGGHGRDRDRGRGERERVVVQVQSPAQNVVRDEDEDRNNDEDEDERGVVSRVDALVAALNNQVAALTNREVEEEDEDEAFEVERLSVISLATLETGLATADAATVTNAVNANTSALQTFLASDTANANAVKAALSAANLDSSKVLAVLRARDERLIAVTA
jgi:hypothetical protein